MERYDIRAEYPNGQFRDFRVSGESVSDARRKAEDEIRAGLANAAIEWRGLVAFVNRSA